MTAAAALEVRCVVAVSRNPKLEDELDAADVLDRRLPTKHGGGCGNPTSTSPNTRR
jgi:hypothetical protein